MEKFYALHARELNTVQGHRRLCSPKVGYLLALRPGTVQLVHHFHQEEVDNFHGEEGEIWALIGAGGTASTIVIGTRGAFDRLSGESNNWPTMAKWNKKSDVTSTTDKFKANESKAATRKPRAVDKRNTNNSGGSGRTRRSTATMTPKMKEYKQEGHHSGL